MDVPNCPYGLCGRETKLNERTFNAHPLARPISPVSRGSDLKGDTMMVPVGVSQACVSSPVCYGLGFCPAQLRLGRHEYAPSHPGHGRPGRSMAAPTYYVGPPLSCLPAKHGSRGPPIGMWGAGCGEQKKRKKGEKTKEGEDRQMREVYIFGL